MLVLLGLFGGLILLARLGYMPMIKQMFDELKDKGADALSVLKRGYDAIVVPIVRKLAIFSGILLLVGAWVTGKAVASSDKPNDFHLVASTGWWIASLSVIAFSIILWVLGFRWSGTATIPAGSDSVTVTYPGFFGQVLKLFRIRPRITIKPFTITPVVFVTADANLTGFRVKQILPLAPPGAPAAPLTEQTFTWTSAVRSGNTELRLVMVAFVGFLAFALTTFFGGLWMGNELVVLSGAPFAILVLVMFAALDAAGVWGIKQGADALEFLPNALLKLSGAISSGDYEDLKKFLASRVTSSDQSFSPFSQEGWDPARKKRFNTLLGVAITAYAWAFIWPNLIIGAIIQFASFMTFGYLFLQIQAAEAQSDRAKQSGNAKVQALAAANELAWATRLSSSVRTYIALTSLGMVIKIIVLLGSVNGTIKLRTDIWKSWLFSMWTGSNGIHFFGYTMAAVGLVGFGALALFLHPGESEKKDDDAEPTTMDSMRKNASMVFGALAVIFAVGGLAMAIFKQSSNRGDMLTIDGVRSSTMPKPTIVRSEKQQLSLSWQQVSDAVDYRIEYRKPTEKTYTSFDKGFGLGVTSYVIACPVSEKILMRMVAVYQRGETMPSEDVPVDCSTPSKKTEDETKGSSVPLAVPMTPKPAPTVAVIPLPAPTVNEPCTSGGCAPPKPGSAIAKLRENIDSE